MKRIITLRSDLSKYQRIVMLATIDGKKRLAHSFYYNGKNDSNYLLFLYKDELPSGSFLDAWNTLDDNSIQITIVPEPTFEQAIDDFMAAWTPDKLGEEIEVIEVSDFNEMQEVIDKKESNELMFLAIRK